MRFFLLASGVVSAVAQKQCHSISPPIGDDWCNANCNNVPAYCPATICVCGPPTPAPPTVAPTPGPPTVAPTPIKPIPPPSKLPDEIIGYYSWCWDSGSQGPPGGNMGVAFTGWTDVQQSIDSYSIGPDCCPVLKGLKTLSLGGGNDNGKFDEAHLRSIITDMDKIRDAGYSGVIFDIEEVDGPSSVMAPLFSKSFAAAHEAGLLAMLTTSHTAPYQCDSAEDAVNLVKAWCADPNLDVMSPQLYSSGNERRPELVPTDFCAGAGCTWDLYKDCKAEIAPSIVDPSHYKRSKDFFWKKIGRKTKGYYMWAQTTSVQTTSNATITI